MLLYSFLLLLHSCFTPAFYILWEESEGLRRDRGWEHVVLQQRAAGEAPLHDPPDVCVLMHVGAAQARTRLQERQRVSPVGQVRDACGGSWWLDVTVVRADGLVRKRACN
jgi:hypothetical protein